ncbi:DEAD/DEAH box helicase [Aureibacter tunicatorum]|uniref:ATP-dependent RNA helicase DeaD n=1 Tax=Aureibacter tunicatorum TaxID=866807 RepID=A0AAE3XQL1_9BACT|nr:DEAD/DEAH box helicase [Aureibacter tunicatorum]MDR6240787.1 ATP-dependent RNA helicase DeaD [Aureibacter tunicatorum]BDD06880.1 DEAD/DEAH box helicase [Aureibacter tunicatorum]
MTSFSETGLKEEILSALETLGFEKPTPIQEKTIPHLLNSKQDIIASAQTGTGKTAAFGLPVIHNIDVDNRKPQALILCPTRELCLQIANDLTQFSKFIKGLEIVAVYGGASIEPQIKALGKVAQVVVATPGRAKDLISRRKLNLSNVERVVLDEADEMLSMGFKDDLDAILSSVPEERQTLLFSATMSGEVKRISNEYMNEPIELSAARINLGSENVSHVFYQVHAKDRYEVLKRIADINPNIYGIVFCRTRKETKDIASQLMQDGYNADALHGDLSQAQRDEVMGKFRSRQLQMLVATDVAARGLDVNELTHVINFNLPDDPEVYTHRSGRTGRAGNKGISVAIIHSREMRRIKDIERNSSIKFKKELVPNGKDICTRQLYALIDKIEKVEVNEQQIEPFLPEIYQKLEWLSREDLIKHFVSAEFNRFLAYYKNAKDINLPDKKERKERSESRDRGNSKMSRLYINLGAHSQLTPLRLIGIVNEALDSSSAEIGKIEIMNRFSFFEIDTATVDKLIANIKDFDFRGQEISIERAQQKDNNNSSSKYRGRGEGRKRDSRRSSGDFKKGGNNSKFRGKRNRR